MDPYTSKNIIGLYKENINVLESLGKRGRVVHDENILNMNASKRNDTGNRLKVFDFFTLNVDNFTTAVLNSLTPRKGGLPDQVYGQACVVSGLTIDLRVRYERTALADYSHPRSVRFLVLALLEGEFANDKFADVCRHFDGISSIVCDTIYDAVYDSNRWMLLVDEVILPTDVVDDGVSSFYMGVYKQYIVNNIAIPATVGSIDPVNGGVYYCIVRDLAVAGVEYDLHCDTRFKDDQNVASYADTLKSAEASVPLHIEVVPEQAPKATAMEEVNRPIADPRFKGNFYNTTPYVVPYKPRSGYQNRKTKTWQKFFDVMFSGKRPSSYRGKYEL